MSPPGSRRWLLLAAWIAGLSAIAWLQPRHASLDHDEVYWVGSAYYFDLAALQRDWHTPAWQLLPARENPPLAKYVLGFGLWLGGHRVTTLDPLGYFYLRWLRWEQEPDRTAAGHEPALLKRVAVLDATSPGFRHRQAENTRAPLTRAMVDAGRSTVRLMSFFAAGLLLLLAVHAGRLAAGVIASLALLLHPYLMDAAGRAMSDVIALTFALAAVFATQDWYGRVARSANLRPSVLLPVLQTGVLLGLACAAKMNGAIIAVTIGVLVLVEIGRRDHPWPARAAVVVQAAGIAVVALLVFSLINPTVLQDPLGGLRAVVLEHRQTEQLHTDLANSRLDTWSQKLAAVAQLGFGGWLPLLGCLGAAGFLVYRQWHDPAIRVAVSWWLAAIVCTVAWIPFAWTRYLIPVLAPTLWLAALMVMALFDSRQHIRNPGNRDHRLPHGAA